MKKRTNLHQYPRHPVDRQDDRCHQGDDDRRRQDRRAGGPVHRQNRAAGRRIVVDRGLCPSAALPASIQDRDVLFDRLHSGLDRAVYSFLPSAPRA